MAIRSATLADLSAIRALLEAEPGSWQPGWTTETVGAALTSAGELAVVAVADGAVIGFACAHDVGFRAYLSELVVAPAARRGGVATALLAAIEHQLTARGRRVLVADVWPPAEAFYRACGWDAPSAVLLRKQLG